MIFRIAVMHCERVGLALCLLISSTSTRTIWRRYTGLGLLPYAIAERIPVAFVKGPGMFLAIFAVFEMWKVCCLDH